MKRFRSDVFFLFRDHFFSRNECSGLTVRCPPRDARSRPHGWGTLFEAFSEIFVIPLVVIRKRKVFRNCSESLEIFTFSLETVRCSGNFNRFRPFLSVLQNSEIFERIEFRSFPRPGSVRIRVSKLVSDRVLYRYVVGKFQKSVLTISVRRRFDIVVLSFLYHKPLLARTTPLKIVQICWNSPL